MKPFGLRTKLTLTYVAVFALVLTALGAFAYQTLASRLASNVDVQLEEMAAGLRGYVRFVDGQPLVVADANDPEEQFFVQTAGRYLEIYDVGSGELLYQSHDMQILNLELSPAEVTQAVNSLGAGEIENERILLRIHNSLLRSDPSQAYLMRVGVSLVSTRAALRQFRRILLLLVPVGIFAAGLGGLWMARAALHPIQELTGAARAISTTRLEDRLPLRGADDELDRLAAAFNEVLARLGQAVQQMRDFTANISHELRTPLTALRGEAEVALSAPRSSEEYRRVLESQLEEVDKLKRLVNELMTLARAEAGAIRLRSDPVDLLALARVAVELLQPVADERGISVSLEASSPVEVMGDPEWLERMVVNLLDNAIKFTQAGGNVRVQVGTENSCPTFTVSDTGIGIAGDALPHIFERFYRADDSRSTQVPGSGLGLALVRWIADAHQARIRSESEPGAGTCFTVVFPAMLARFSTPQTPAPDPASGTRLPDQPED